MHKLKFSVFIACALLAIFLSSSVARADELYGRIRGTVTDPTGAVVPGVPVTATNIATGIGRTGTTGADGYYELVNLPAPATYTVAVERTGFRRFEATGVALALNQTYVLNIRLELGPTTQQVTVEAASVQVETTSIERGIQVSGQQISDMPLLGRNWIELQQIEPGVVASDDRFGNNYSTNGSETQQNSYLINGVDSADIALNTPLVVPSPDAISEFQMVTSTINPEFGRNSGAILNAAIKSGTNTFHGDAFEFFRDTGLNARNFFQVSPSVFHQNQFGGTIGGPIWKQHTFFFFSYQGNRFSEAEGFSLPTVGPAAEQHGDFSASSVPIASSGNSSPIPLYGDSASPCPVGGSPCKAGTPYATLFSTNVIPTADFNTVSQGLISSYLPPPNFGGNKYTFSPLSVGKQDQELWRIDHTFSPKDSIWEYSLFESDPRSDALPFVGGNLPGFGQTQQVHTQEHTFDWQHTFGGNTLNEFRAGYTRLNFLAVTPQKAVLPSSVGFVGITPQYPGGAGVPAISVAGADVNFELGFSIFGPQPRIDQTYQVEDNFSYIHGKHTFKMGFEGRRFDVYNPFYDYNNGYFTYGGTGAFSTGNPMADFLLGFPDSYTQSTGNIIISRAYEAYSYFQDQWKIRPNLTLTYGTGWDIETPLSDFMNHSEAINCFIPSQQSSVFPSAPAGLNFPGDTGCNAAGYNTHYTDFGPRLGFAWSPNWGWLSGGPGKLSIRAGWGMYYNRTEEELTLQFLTDPPFALTDYGISDIGGVPSFSSPFTDVECISQTQAAIPCTPKNGNPPSLANKYPFTAPKRGSSPSFGFFEPMGLATIDPNFRSPYAENYNLTIERALPADAILSIAYVGSMGHRLEMWYERNPGIPGECAADPTCASNPFFTWLFPQYHQYDSTVFGSIGTMASMGNSNYNSLQISVTKRPTHGLYFQTSYTYAHSLDWSSSFEDEAFGPLGTDPFNFRRFYGDSSFDARQRLAINFGYSLPKIPGTGHGLADRLVNGWRIAGGGSFETGFPVHIANNDFGLLGTTSGTCPGTPMLVVSVACWDAPNVSGPVPTLNPRSTSNNEWFNPAPFSNACTPGAPAPGCTLPFNPETGGDAGRNLLHGPGINNWDAQLTKEFRIHESVRIQFRGEFYNLFNHAQFANPDGNLADGSSFGTISGIQGRPRIAQLVARFIF